MEESMARAMCTIYLKLTNKIYKNKILNLGWYIMEKLKKYYPFDKKKKTYEYLANKFIWL